MDEIVKSTWFQLAQFGVLGLNVLFLGYVVYFLFRKYEGAKNETISKIESLMATHKADLAVIIKDSNESNDIMHRALETLSNGIFSALGMQRRQGDRDDS